MPYVNVKIAGQLSTAQKKEIALQITNTLKEVANKPPEYTYVVFEEINGTNWAVAGELLDSEP